MKECFFGKVGNFIKKKRTNRGKGKKSPNNENYKQRTKPSQTRQLTTKKDKAQPNNEPYKTK